VAGERLSRRPEDERARVRGRSIGVLFQQGNLVGHLTVQQNVALAQQLRHDGGSAASRAQLLDRVGIGDRAHARPGQLSGGELARAGLAVALANDPAVLLADEPTGELDEHTAAGVLEVLRERARAGTGVVLVTHSPRTAAVADRELPLRDGRIEQ
jgi:putative ABC transport system ATP-binding protein